MLLSKLQFEDLLQSGNLKISLIGMSNVGKTYWSKRLSDVGFLHVSCDGLIEEKLRREIPEFGERGIRGVAHWMGQPHEDGFEERQRKYLEHEASVMREIVHAAREKARNVVIDTTGSVVHAGDDVCATLKEHSLVVYIEVPKGSEQQMLELYLQEPKPVVWEHFFTQTEGEPSKDALARSYLALLDFRAKRFRHYADIVVPRPAMRRKTSSKEIIDCIKNEMD